MVRIFSNFDTQAPTKNYAQAVREFGFDKVVFLRRHVLYFTIYVILPTIISLALIVVWTLYAFFSSGSADIFSEIIVFLIALYFAIVALSRYFNYTLDYTIITPGYISSYNQKGILNREIITIEPEKIKTITFSSNWFVNSVFNFWSVTILLEWDNANNGEIYMDFIHKPEQVKESILRITDEYGK